MLDGVMCAMRALALRGAHACAWVWFDLTRARAANERATDRGFARACSIDYARFDW
jgi:hypothetical protein